MLSKVIKTANINLTTLYIINMDYDKILSYECKLIVMRSDNF